MAKLNLVIKKIDKNIYDGVADIAILKTIDGELGVMANHIPIVSVLNNGWIKIKNDGQENIFNIKKAIAKIKDNRLCVLCFD